MVSRHCVHFHTPRTAQLNKGTPVLLYVSLIPPLHRRQNEGETHPAFTKRDTIIEAIGRRRDIGLGRSYLFGHMFFITSFRRSIHTHPPWKLSRVGNLGDAGSNSLHYSRSCFDCLLRGAALSIVNRRCKKFIWSSKVFFLFPPSAAL